MRKSKTVNNKVTEFVWDGSEIAAEIDGNYDVIRNKYIYGLDRVLCEGPYSVNTYYQQNSHGDTIAITDFYADTLVMYEYDAFGNQLDADPNDTNPFRYCGQYLDDETGSYYLRARYYQPTYGRFLTADFHWNIDNMIYGDMEVDNISILSEVTNFSECNHRFISPFSSVLFFNFAPANDLKEDATSRDCLNNGITSAKLPAIDVILQSGNLYTYTANKPLCYVDPSGENGIFYLILFCALTLGYGWLASSGGMPSHNYDQNRQVDEAVRRYNLTAEGRRLLHDNISGQNYSYQEVMGEAEAIARMGGKYVK